MEKQLSAILGKPNDFKICSYCGQINYYENEECINCHNSMFKPTGNGIIDFVSKEYDFYEESGYKEEDIDDLWIEV